MDMPGTALSLSAAILGALQGQIGSLIHKWLDYKYRVKKLKSDQYLSDKNNARNVKGEKFLITRRIIAIMVISTLCFSPVIGYFTGLPIYVFYSESNGFFSSLFYGNYTVHNIPIDGIPILPELSYLSTLIGTLYFGSKEI